MVIKFIWTCWHYNYRIINNTKSTVYRYESGCDSFKLSDAGIGGTSLVNFNQKNLNFGQQV